MLKVGDQVPPFRLQAGTGQAVESGSLLGSRWVIYFYPKDNTAGCTIETREFGKVMGVLAERGIRVFGCSIGSVDAKREFAASCDAAELPLLADPDHAVADSFGVWGPRKFAGHEYMGISRTTFLIDAAGIVEKVWTAVKPEGHAAEVVEATTA